MKKFVKIFDTYINADNVAYVEATGPKNFRITMVGGSTIVGTFGTNDRGVTKHYISDVIIALETGVNLEN